MRENFVGGKQNKLRWLGRALLYILLLASVLAATAGGVGTKFLAEMKLFSENNEYIAADEGHLAEYVGRRLIYLYLFSGMDGVTRYCEDTDIMYALYTKNGRRVGGNIPLTYEKNAYVISYSEQDIEELGFSKHMGEFVIKLSFNDKDSYWDSYVFYSRLMKLMAGYRYCFPAALVLGCIFAALSFVLLMRAREGQPLFGRIPLELVTAAAAAVVYHCSKRLTPGGRFIFTDWAEWRAVAVIAAVCTLYFLHLFSRVRTEGWHQSTLCYILFIWLRKLAKLCRELFYGLPMVWRTALGLLALSVLEFAAIWTILPKGRGKGILLGLWLAEKLVLIPFLLRRSLTLKKIRRAAGELAAGNLNYQVETAVLPKSLQDFGKDINAVSDSVSMAVEDRMKSERLKTELITNVSHDIKTPLTSIINFADLISREQTDNPRITEYAALLHKQSSRLKKLIEDLIEASKASTGNLEVDMVPCEVRTLLAQCLGEYEQRLQELDIDMIVKLGQEPVWIMADTRLLWRIFENLMSNICKYAQRETRVYLSMEQWGDGVSITFKNISKYPLDISPDDLMERFVRGDLSRHTEGNGLGLSIVRSLMDLLGGRIELAVDGDLFKAILQFPVIEKPTYPEANPNIL